MIALDQLASAHFAACIGQPFLCASGFTLTLAEVAKVGSPRPGVSRVPFALRFTAPPELRLAQQIYPLKNDTLGELEIFLVQTGVDAAASHFEAIFS